MSLWTTEDSFVTGTRHGDPPTPRGAPWWSLKRYFDCVRGDCDELVLTVPIGYGAASPYTHRVQLSDRAQHSDTRELIRNVRRAFKHDAQSLWRKRETEAQFWTVWYRLVTGMPQDHADPCYSGIAFLAEHVAHACAPGDEHACDTRFSEQNLEAIDSLESALRAGDDKDKIKTYGYICLKLWERYEDTLYNWLRCQFVLKALKCDLDPNLARVLQSCARLADLVAKLNGAGWSRVIKRRHVRASFYSNPLRPMAIPPSSAAAESSTLEVWYDGFHAMSCSSTLYQGVQVQRDGTYRFVAVKALSEFAQEPQQLSQRIQQLHAWFRDDYVRQSLSEPVCGPRAPVFPNFGVYELCPNQPISVSPWALHGNINLYVRKRVKEIHSDNGRTHELILDLMEQLLPVVKEVHDAKLVHGNLKGNNILITENAILQLADFGSYDVSSAPDCATNRSSIPWHKSRMVAKSGVFMSPELRRSGTPTKESDMWAVSCVFLELYLAASHAFTPHGHVLRRSDMDQRHPRIPPKIWDLIRANWVEDPRQRLSAAEMHRQLNQVRDNMPVQFRK